MVSLAPLALVLLLGLVGARTPQDVLVQPDLHASAAGTAQEPAGTVWRPELLHNAPFGDATGMQLPGNTTGSSLTTQWAGHASRAWFPAVSSLDSRDAALGPQGDGSGTVDAPEEGLSRVPLNEVTPAGVANTTLVSVDHWSCTNRPRGLHKMSAAHVRLRVELFCSDACCNENYLDPLQHNEPGRVGQYDRPPECLTSYSSSIELREVGSGQPVQRLSRHGVYADANNNNTTPEGVVACVLESFTDQDRLKYYDTNGKTGLGSTPRRARIYGG
jgi:hypothetical protein